MHVSKSELEVLVTLMKSSSGLDAFSLFRRLKVSFSDFSKAVRNLTEHGFIREVKDDFYRLTKEGEKYINRQKTTSVDRHWRQVPEKFLASKLKKGSFYIPSVRLLDRKTFKIKDDKVEW